MRQKNCDWFLGEFLNDRNWVKKVVKSKVVAKKWHCRLLMPHHILTAWLFLSRFLLFFLLTFVLIYPITQRQ